MNSELHWAGFWVDPHVKIFSGLCAFLELGGGRGLGDPNFPGHTDTVSIPFSWSEAAYHLY